MENELENEVTVINLQNIDNNIPARPGITIKYNNDINDEIEKSDIYLLLHNVYKEIFLSKTMPNWKNFLFKRFKRKKSFLFGFILLLDIVLRGISQVFLCDHPITGILICIGLILTSPMLLAYALLGTISATFGAILIARPEIHDITSGLCGYDGALVGCACWTFYRNSNDSTIPLITIILASASGYIHVACSHWLGTFGLPTFTLSFNLITMCFLLSISTHHATVVQMNAPQITPHESSYTTMSIEYFLEASVKGVGQFMFADTTVGCILIVIGIAISSRIAALAGLLGAATACLSCYYLLQVPNLALVRSGIFGYNSAGTCAVLAGGGFFQATYGSTLVGIIGALIATLLLVAYQSIFGYLWNLPVLTFPFICSAYLMLLMKTRWLVKLNDPIAGKTVYETNSFVSLEDSSISSLEDEYESDFIEIICK